MLRKQAPREKNVNARSSTRKVEGKGRALGVQIPGDTNWRNLNSKKPCG